MSPLMRELDGHLVGVDRTGERIVGRFRLPGTFAGFQGHFPTGPVLPAVCEVMAVVATWQRWTGRAITVREIVSAKFFAAVVPDQEIAVACREPAEGASSPVLKADVERDGQRVAEIALRVDLGHRVREAP